LKKYWFIGCAVLLALAIIIITLVLTFRTNVGKKSTFPTEPVTLNYWRIRDEKDSFAQMFAEYQKVHSNVTVNYVIKDPATYENDLVNAIAAGSGPDIFMIKNDWTNRRKANIAPISADVMKTSDYKNTFADVATSDFVQDDQVYAIPYSIETIGLFANPKILNDAQARANKTNQPTIAGLDKSVSEIIGQGPKNWDELVAEAQFVTQKSGDQINLSTIAMGTSNNIANASDILSMLMIQNGTKMVSDDKTLPTFNQPQKKSDGTTVNPGTLALDFYTSFAKPSKTTYSWNTTTPQALDAFIQGKVSMIFGDFDTAQILSKEHADLEFKLITMPQVKGVADKTYYADYWGETVNKNTKYPNVAWDLIKFIATNDKAQKIFEKSIQRPPSLKSATQTLSAGSDWHNIFADQVENAKTWYKGTNPQKVDEEFNNMINLVATGGQQPQTAIDTTAENIKKFWQQ
jgi:ABC-type glycerol-3-phosphate transport system substrate-binding protein